MALEMADAPGRNLPGALREFMPPASRRQELASLNDPENAHFLLIALALPDTLPALKTLASV
jgi:hypothetical protein